VSSVGWLQCGSSKREEGNRERGGERRRIEVANYGVRWWVTTRGRVNATRGMVLNVCLGSEVFGGGGRRKMGKRRE
jgi:hypothetical protein